uniref:rRNA maturation RNase YbeY n=1 Tax=Ndongobacter massiliensis TaxID=1871025 RepID=UPI000931A52B|nr:rRNA maturation RNase YbeY [Ndongobacter massiliensis]
MQLWVDNRDERTILTESLERALQRALGMTLEKEGRSDAVEISLSFVNAEEMQRLNRSYRNVDSVTDVLSFPLEEDPMRYPKGALLPLGDIVICMDRVFEQAEAYGHSREREMLYLCVHSLLHLLGYDHETEEEKRVMRRKEEAVMEALGLPQEKS